MCIYMHVYNSVLYRALEKKHVHRALKKKLSGYVRVAASRILPWVTDLFLRWPGRKAHPCFVTYFPCSRVQIELFFADVRNTLKQEGEKKKATWRHGPFDTASWIFCSCQWRTCFLLTCWNKVSYLTWWNLLPSYGTTSCVCGKWCVLMKGHRETVNQ